MTSESSIPSGTVPSSGRYFPLLLLLFVGSGCAALIYEIVWFQLLQLVIGSTAVSLGVLLGTFMGGMCLGSLLLPRIIPARFHPLRVYAWLEIGIGLAGLAILFGMPYISRLYTEHAVFGQADISLRAGVAALCLLPPTLMMGATLPAIARWVETTPKGVSWLGFFYGSNIAGAVAGSVLAGFYLLRVHDMSIATYAAVGLNVLVAVVGLAVASLTGYRAQETAAADDEEPESRREGGTAAIYVAIAISGLTGLAAQVVWARLLSLMLGATVYTFSLILAVFLTGLGIGSSVGSLIARVSERPRFALAMCQLLLAGAIGWAGFAILKMLPEWPIDGSLAATPWVSFQLDLARCAWAILPAATLWGASFPLALAAVATRGRDPGKLVGGVYAANTVGAIIGAFGCSVFLIGTIGAQKTQQVLVALSGLTALMLFARSGRVISDQDGESQPRSGAVSKVISLLFVVAALALLVRSVPSTPWGLIGYGRNSLFSKNTGTENYRGEGMNASIAVSTTFHGARNFHVSGKVVASSEPQDMRLQRMLGHISALFHPEPKSVLIVGCGAAVTAGTFVFHPSIERIVICEIEPLIPPAAGKYFGVENHHVIDDPRVEIIYDDGRHFLQTTKEKFDIITSDPIHPWVKGAASLYSTEYFEFTKARLNPGGVVTQWVPLYESTEAAVKSEIATFMKAFPDGTIWSNDINGEGYDIVLLGKNVPTEVDVDAMQERLERPDHADVKRSMEEVYLGSALRLLSTYSGRAQDLAKWMEDAQINTDHNMRLQYLAGLGLNSFHAKEIFDEILSYRRFPEDLFKGSELNLNQLKMVLSNRSELQW